MPESARTNRKVARITIVENMYAWKKDARDEERAEHTLSHVCKGLSEMGISVQEESDLDGASDAAVRHALWEYPEISEEEEQSRLWEYPEKSGEEKRITIVARLAMPDIPSYFVLLALPLSQFFGAMLQAAGTDAFQALKRLVRKTKEESQRRFTGSGGPSGYRVRREDNDQP